MAKSSEYFNQVTSKIIVLPCSRVLAAACVFLSMTYCIAHAQEKQCSTTKECAQQMVDTANDLKTQNVALTKRVEELEVALREQLRQVNSDLSSWDKIEERQPSTGVTGATGELNCSEGHYVIGLAMVRVSGGINQLQLICRKLPVVQ